MGGRGNPSGTLLAPTLLDVQNLSIVYPDSDGALCAVQDLSFCMEHGETLCLLGESGSGKSSIALTLTGLLDWDRHVAGGRALLERENLGSLSRREWKKIRGRRISLLFQDARSSLNPVLTVGDHLTETLRAHQRLSAKDAFLRGQELLRDAGIRDPEFCMRRYPFELSGGMCRRVALALGICNRPQLLIADEPTGALDPSIQAQVVELLQERKRSLGMALLLITHDLVLASEIGDRVAVMYHGNILEVGRAREVFAHPAHPYTRALIECLPRKERSNQNVPLQTVPGVAPPPGQRPAGCVFASRCSLSEARCHDSRPDFAAISETHRAACLKV
jgi:peptide/nickel transport system ATP-binding protein